MKRVLSLLLVVLLTLSCLPVTAVTAVTASGTCGSNVHWTLYSDGKLVISGTGPMYDYEATTTNGNPWMMDYYSSVQTIVIENGVTTIGDYAFYGLGLITDVSISNSVTSIGAYSFQACRQLTEVTIPNSVHTIEDGAFSSCSGLTEVTVPDSVTTLGDSAFGYCSGLTEVTLSSGLSFLSPRVFCYDSSLSTIFIPESITTIEGWVFNGCTKLSKVYYGGSQADWAQVSIGPDNSYLTSAAIEYNYSAGNTGNPNIPANAVYFNGNAYAVYNDGLSWDDAKARCEALGGHLVTITSAEEQEFVTTLAETGSQSRYWLGATDTATEGKWQWVTGEPWSYTNWLGGQPDNDNSSEHWLEIYITVRINNILWRGYWNDVSYNFDRNYRGYICEWDLGPSNTNYLEQVKSQMGQIDLGPYALKGATVNIAGYEFPLIDLEAGITLKFGDHLKVITQPEDKTIKVLVGFDEEASANVQQSAASPTYWSDSYQEVKAMYKNLTGNAVDGTRLWNKFSALRGKLKTMKASMVVDVESSLAGYLEFKVEDSGLTFTEGGMLASFEADTSLRSYYGPCYVALGIGVGVDGSLVFTNENNKVNPAITVSPSFTLSAGGGIGTDSTYAQLDAYGTLMASIDSKASAPFQAGADIGVRWEGYIIGKEIFSDSKSFASMELYPNFGDPWAVSTLSLTPEVDVSDADEYRDLLNAAQPISRDYLNAPALFSRRYRGASFVKENTYPLSSPKLVSFADDTMLLVWIDDDGSKTAENAGSLMYSFFDGQTWSEPAALYEDGTANDMPAVYSDGQYAYLVWQRATKVFEPGTKTEDMLPCFDLYATTFDSQTRQFSSFMCVTEQPNTAFEMNPTVQGSDGSFYVLWTENSENNIYQMSGENSLHYATVSTFAEQSYETVITATNSMISDLVLVSSEPYYCLLEDGEKNLYNFDTCIAQKVGAVVSVHGEQFAYSTDEGLWLYNIAEASPRSLSVGPLNNFRFASSPDGNSRALFTLVLNEDFSKTLYYTTTGGNWSSFQVYSHPGTDIRDYCPVMLSDGTVQVAFNYVESDPESGARRADLVVDLSTDAVDVQLDYVDFMDEQVSTGTVDFTLGITNNSSSVLDAFDVSITDADGTVIYSQTVEGELTAFDSTLLTIPCPLPEHYTNGRYTFRVLPADYEDLNEENNCVDTTVEALQPVYDVTAAASEYGTLELSKTSGLAGDVVTVTALPKESFVLKSIQVNGKDIDGTTFTIQEGSTVSAVFACVVRPGDVMYFPGDPVGKEYVEGYLVSSDTPNQKIFFYFEGGFSG